MILIFHVVIRNVLLSLRGYGFSVLSIKARDKLEQRKDCMTPQREHGKDQSDPKDE